MKRERQMPCLHSRTKNLLALHIARGIEHMQCHPLINILHYTAPSGNTSCGSPQLLVSRPAYALNGRQGLAVDA